MRPLATSSQTSTLWRTALPPMLAGKWRAAQLADGDPREAMSGWADVALAVLNLAVAVLHADHVTRIHEPLPQAFVELERRGDRASMGTWLAAARELARDLATQPTSAVPCLTEGLCPGAALYDALARLVELRNRMAHKGDGGMGLPTPAFREIQQEAIEPLRVLQIELRELRHHPMGWLERIEATGGSGRPVLMIARGVDLAKIDVPSGDVPAAEVPFILCGDGALLTLGGWAKIVYVEGGTVPKIALLARTGRPRTRREVSDVGCWLHDSGVTGLEARPALAPAVHRHAHVASEIRKLDGGENVAPPKQVGPYRIVDRLGHGGAGRVYHAVDTRPGADPKDVAVKILHPALMEDRFAKRRLEEEVRVLTRLGLPGVARRFDSGVDEALGQFLVLELCHDGSLQDRLDHEGPMRLDLAVGLVMDLLETLHALHGEGVVHRDIKPGNVLLRDGRPILVDFGIARAADRDRMTGDVEVLGSRRFAAPEQLAGREVGPPTDLYAVGRLLEILLPDPCPPGLSAVVRRATAVDPADRYSTAAAMRVDLAEAVERGDELGPVREGDVVGGARVVGQALALGPQVWTCEARGDDQRLRLVLAIHRVADRLQAAVRRLDAPMRAHLDFQGMASDGGLVVVRFGADCTVEHVRSWLAGTLEPPDPMKETVQSALTGAAVGASATAALLAVGAGLASLRGGDRAVRSAVKDRAGQAASAGVAGSTGQLAWLGIRAAGATAGLAGAALKSFGKAAARARVPLQEELMAMEHVREVRKVSEDGTVAFFLLRDGSGGAAWRAPGATSDATVEEVRKHFTAAGNVAVFGVKRRGRWRWWRGGRWLN